MYIYIIIAIILSLLVLKPDSKAGLAVSFVILFAVAAFRGLNVGVDTGVTYLYQFKNHTDVRFMEYGWYALRELVAMFAPYRVHILISALLTLVPLYYYAWRNGKNAAFIILFYFLLYNYCSSLNTMRQFVAISFVLLATLYMDGKRQWLFYVWVVVAATFHTSALVMLLLPLLNRVKMNQWYVTATLLATFVLGFFNTMEFMNTAITKFNLGYINYFGVSYTRDVTFSLSRMLLNAMVILLLFLSNKDSLWLKTFVVGVLVLNLFPMFPDVGRIAKYFLVFQAILFPTLEFNPGTTRETRQIIRCGLWVYSYRVLFYLLSANVGGVVPYSFAWL